MSTFDFGRKVAFLGDTHNEESHLIKELIYNEYEVYLMDNPESLDKFLVHYPDSVCFICFDNNHNVNENIEFLKRVTNSTEEIKTVFFGYSRLPDSKIIQRLKGLVSRFFLFSKGDVSELDNVLQTLDQLKIKGRRSSVRVQIRPGTGTVNIKRKANSFKGDILDLSSGAFACKIESPDFNLFKGEVVKELQIKAGGKLFISDTYYMGSRKDINSIKIFAFRHPDEQSRMEICSMVFSLLQTSIKGIFT